MRKLNLIRVTSVLSFVESSWKEYWWRKVGFKAADKIGKDSSEFGTKVHGFIEEALIKGPGGIIEIDSPHSPLVSCGMRIVNYLTQSNIEPLINNSWKDSLEVEVKDEKLGLIGHFDLAALVDGEPCIVDFKTSKSMRKSFPLQKAAYAKMANKQLGLKIDRGMTIRSHWDKEREAVDFEVKTYDNLIKKYWPKFKACLEVWMYFNRVSK